MLSLSSHFKWWSIIHACSETKGADVLWAPCGGIWGMLWPWSGYPGGKKVHVTSEMLWVLCAPLKPPHEWTHKASSPGCLLPARTPCNITPSRLLLHTGRNLFALAGPVYMYRTDLNNFKRAAVSVLWLMALEQWDLPDAVIPNVLQRRSGSHTGVWWSSSISCNLFQGSISCQNPPS